jgi:hypothetical protein
MKESIRQAIRNEFGIEYNVRKMSDEEILDNDVHKYWCSEETGHIFKEEELTFLE